MDQLWKASGRIGIRKPRVLVAGLFIAGILSADGFDSSAWQYRQPFRVPVPDQITTLDLDRAIYPRSRADLGDLRVVRNGLEIPYVIQTLDGKVEQTETEPRVINRGVVPGAAVQFTMDLGSHPSRHSRLRILSGARNFRNRVRIETSDNNSFWTVVRDDGYIFDFSQGDFHADVMTVDYPPSTMRYVRATVFGFDKPTDVTGARSLFHQDTPADRDIVSTLLPIRTEDPKTRTSLLVLDLALPNIPHDRIRIDTGTLSFHRAVELEYSDDGKDWRVLTRGVLYQVPGEQSLSISFRERRERFMRLRIFNGDNAPVPVPRVYAETLRRVMKMPPYPQGDYMLYFGNPKARPPEYDLGAILARQAPGPETSAQAEKWAPNPAYIPPPGEAKPWTDRYPGLLYGILGLAILVMGFVTIRLMRKVSHSR